MWLSKFSCVLCLIAVCAAQEPDTAPTLPPATTYERPVPVLQNGKTVLDVFPTEEVELTCDIPGSSDWSFTWSTADGEIQASGDGSVLTVTAQKDEEFVCEGHHKTRKVSSQPSNKLQLKVAGSIPKPKVIQRSNSNPVFPGEEISFTCTLEDNHGWEFVWYHNAKELQGVTNTLTVEVSPSSRGKYHCRAKRGKGPFYTADSDPESLEVFEPPTPSLELRSPYPDVFENEEVEFKCTMDAEDPEWFFLFFRDQKKFEEDDLDDNMDLDEYEGWFNITSVRRSDAGRYTCKAYLGNRFTTGPSNVTILSVYDNLPKPTIRRDPSFSPMYVGEKVTFTCGVSVSKGWEYLWYRDENQLPRLSGAVISVSLASPADGGKYWCKARRGEITTTDASEKIALSVLEIPTPQVKRLTKWPNVFPTEKAKFQCGIQDGAGWKYTWYRDSEQLVAAGALSFDSDGATLSINSASDEHEGRYECEGNLPNRPVSSRSNTPLDLTIYGKKPTATVKRDTEYTVMYPGESVTFTCHMDLMGEAPEWEYTWYKNGKQHVQSQNTFTVQLAGANDGGSYKCEAKRGTGDVFTTDPSQSVLLEVRENGPEPSIALQPDVDQLYVGESATFHCDVQVSSEWNYQWFKDGQPLAAGSTYKIDAVGLSDDGIYQCKAERNKTKFATQLSSQRKLIISEIPVPSLINKTRWLDVFPTESVTFDCGMQLNRSIWKYVWYKDTVEVKGDAIASLGPDGTTLSVAVHSASQSGKYSCEGKLKSREVTSKASPPLTLKVYDESPAFTLTQEPVHSSMHTGDSVSFGCHVNVSSGWDYQWFRSNSKIAPSGKHHNISSIRTLDTGSYQCQITRQMNTVFSVKSSPISLEVQERPQASIELLTGWSEVFSTDSLTLNCEVLKSRDEWNYTWYKEKKEIQGATAEKYFVTPQNDPDQSEYTCRGVRSGRPAYSQTSISYKTKNLLLKRRLLLSISGIIVFGIIATFLGCILFRVFRKPVDDDDKPEDVNLFLSMAQLKDLTADAPCPLMEYITDSSLKAAPKEVEENGTVCSETTPLPISSQEENGVAEDDQEKEEKNGGLLSFQQ